MSDKESVLRLKHWLVVLSDIKSASHTHFSICTQRDIVFLSAKPGNQDEVSIDQVKRHVTNYVLHMIYLMLRCD